MPPRPTKKTAPPPAPKKKTYENIEAAKAKLVELAERQEEMASIVKVQREQARHEGRAEAYRTALDIIERTEVHHDS